MHLPRFGKGYKMYPKIFPSMELNVTPVTQNCEYAKIYILLKYNLLIFSDVCHTRTQVFWTHKNPVCCELNYFLLVVAKKASEWILLPSRLQQMCCWLLSIHIILIRICNDDEVSVHISAPQYCFICGKMATNECYECYKAAAENQMDAALFCDAHVERVRYHFIIHDSE